MTTWNYITVVLCLILLAFMCWKEWQRTDNSRLAFRLLASLLAVVSFACLALPLKRKVQAAGTQEGQAVLLTEGFNKDSVNSFLHNFNDSIPVYIIDKNLTAGTKNYKARYVSTADWPSIKQQVSAVHIFGYGLDKNELQILPRSLFVFHPSKIADGITSVTWQKKIHAGDQLLVQGSFVNASSSAIKLILAGYDVDLDTATIPAKSKANFELSDVPKLLGKAVYAIRAVSGHDTLENEPVPFETDQSGQLKILILSASPDFENKFLKLWLSQNSYALVTRTTISKGKYEKTFRNTAQISFSSITPSFLGRFDVLIADLAELTAMSKPEIAAVESQVALKGMGLIVKGDSAPAKMSFYSRPFRVTQDSGNNKKTLSLFIPVINQPAAALATEHPAYIRQQPGTQSLIADKQLNTVVSSSIYGAGKLIFTTINNTFTWMLSGDNKNYQAFWSFLLQKAAAKTDIEKSWSISTAFPYANKAVDINYASNSAETPQVQIGENFVYLTQNPDLLFQWQGSYWPQRSGWQPIMQNNQNRFWWYVYNVHDWKAISASQKIQSTRQSIAENRNDASKDRQPMLATVAVSKKYFFIIFLLCAGFLWFEKKL